MTSSCISRLTSSRTIFKTQIAPVYGYIGLAPGCGVTALLIVVFTRGRMGYQHYRAENASLVRGMILLATVVSISGIAL
jgi:hypothetical protein